MSERDSGGDRAGEPGRHTDSERFSIAVTYGPADNRGVLLKLITALHRRRIDPVALNLADSVDGQRCFRAAFAATPERARVAVETLRNVIGVAEVSIAKDH